VIAENPQSIEKTRKIKPSKISLKTTTNQFTIFISQNTKTIANIHYNCRNKHCPKDPIRASNALIQEKQKKGKIIVPPDDSGQGSVPKTTFSGES
jgi:thiamine pyrophosphokinase